MNSNQHSKAQGPDNSPLGLEQLTMFLVKYKGLSVFDLKRTCLPYYYYVKCVFA
jgi:hypothetical protein